MTENLVLIEHRDAVAIVRLNRPEAMNAVNTPLRAALIPALLALDADPAVRAIVLAGHGERAFCAGQDLLEASTMRAEGIAAWLNQQHRMYATVRGLNKPCVAALNGVAAGAGFQLSLVSDLRIGYPDMRLGQPEVRAGLGSIVGSYLLSLQVGLSVNQQLSLTGELISGERGHQLGLINELCPKERVVDRAVERARELAAIAPTAMRLSKERFRLLSQAGFDEACNAGIRYQLECYASGEPQREMAAFLARRKG